MSRSLLGLALAAAALLMGAAGSCVDFDGQLVLARRNADRDRLDVLLVYRNLHASEADLGPALEQAERLADGARWAAVLGNWPFMVDLDRMLAEDDGESPAGTALLDALDRNVELVPGRLWLDPEHGLCAWQLLRVRNLAAVTEAGNVALREALLADDAAGLVDLFEEWQLEDDASLARARKALSEGWPLLRWEGSALQFAFPVADEGWVQMKRAILTEVIRSACDTCQGTDGQPLDDEETAHGIELLARNEWSLGWSPGAITATLGHPSQPELRLLTPVMGKPQAAALIEAFRERGWEIADEDLDQAALAAYEAWVADD